MFRALAGFADMDHKQYVDQQTTRFTQQLANAYMTPLPTSSKTKPSDVLAGSQLGLSTYDPNTRQTHQRNIDLKNYATSIEINQDLIDAQQRCKTGSLNDLLNTYNPADKIRCGWIYQKGTPGDQPKVSVGALGTRNGPAGFFENPKGTWYWSLEDAEKAIMGDRCGALTNCKNVGAANYQGCAFSKTRGIGIPVNAKGGIRYPRDPALTAPASSLVFESGKCPPPPAPGSPQDAFARSRDVCMPLEDGRLSRDCMLQQITNAGCQMDGSLYQAIATANNPNNYAAGIMDTTFFKRYQQMATTPLLDAAITQGKTTQDLALANFKALNKEASVVKEDVMNYAARDMCIKKGTFDKFDFCTELLDGSSPPFAIECLQKEFRRQGGQPAGSMYPTNANKSTTWDALGKWGNVKQYIADLATQTKSPKESVQRQALEKFYGIKRTTSQIGQIARIPGVEVLWFNRGNGAFIGRRLGMENGEFPNFNTGGEVEGTGLADFVEFYVVTNLRPPTDQTVSLFMITDDGIAYTLNRTLDGDATRGRFEDTANSFIANWDQAPTGYIKKNCWTLAANGPNYMMGFWQETGGGATHQMNYKPCQGGSWQGVPLDWYTQSQEPDAPVFSWQGLKSEGGNMVFVERRFPTVMALNLAPSVIVSEVPEDAIPKLGAVARLKGSGNGLGTSKKLLAMNSWRTITTAFFLNNTTTGVFMNLGPLTVSIEGGQLSFSWQGSTLSANGKFGGLVADGKTPHLLVVNMRSDYKGRYPNRLSVAVGTFADWKSGRVGLQPGSSQFGSYTTNNNAPLYSNNDAFQLKVGDPNSRATADVSVGWFRVFDYEMDSNDIQRDCDNAWQMAFINL